MAANSFVPHGFVCRGRSDAPCRRAAGTRRRAPRRRGPRTAPGSGRRSAARAGGRRSRRGGGPPRLDAGRRSGGASRRRSRRSRSTRSTSGARRRRPPREGRGSRRGRWGPWARTVPGPELAAAVPPGRPRRGQMVGSCASREESRDAREVEAVVRTQDHEAREGGEARESPEGREGEARPGADGAGRGDVGAREGGLRADAEDVRATRGCRSPCSASASPRSRPCSSASGSIMSWRWRCGTRATSTRAT